MKTAVEWLAEQMLYIDNEYDMKLICKNQYQSKRRDIIEQAKEMEKQQIVDAFIGYDSDTKDNLEVAEQYYNETFKQQEKCKCGQLIVGRYSCQRTDCNQPLNKNNEKSNNWFTKWSEPLI
jgi:hypothetical protein